MTATTSDATASMLKVYNSLTRQYDALEVSPGKVLTQYVCGPTMCDPISLSRARCYVTFDILRRILTDYFGHDVYYVMNITDVDDSITERARQRHVFQEYVKHAPGKGLDRVYTDIQEALMHAPSVQDTHDLCAQLKQAHDECQRLKTYSEMQDGPTPEWTTTEGIRTLLRLAEPVLSPWLFHRAAESAYTFEPQIFQQFTEQREREFLNEMRALNVREVDALTRVSEHIMPIIAYIERILANGYAYVAGSGSVYFDTRAYIRAGFKYCPLTQSDCCQPTFTASTSNNNSSGGSALHENGSLGPLFQEKRHAQDFVMWRRVTRVSLEPGWPSPWGLGVPGWHVECCAMSHQACGQQFDIHGGSADLQFPHHDNEIAQTQSYVGDKPLQWVKQFWHVGSVVSSASPTAVVPTLQTLLEQASGREVRLLFLQHRWTTTLSFTECSIAEARTKDHAWQEFFHLLTLAIRSNYAHEQKWSERDRAFHSRLCQLKSTIRIALCNNFDYVEVLSALTTFAEQVSGYGTLSDAKRLLLQSAIHYVHRMLALLGLSYSLDTQTTADIHTSHLLHNTLNTLCSFRSAVRRIAHESEHDELWQLCDDVRDQRMVQLGVCLEDHGMSRDSTWRFENPVILRREQQARELSQRKHKRHQLIQKMHLLEMQLSCTTIDAIPPPTYFKTQYPDLYRTFDSHGVPKTDAQGKALSKAVLKDVHKRFEQQKRAHEAYTKQCEVDPLYLDKMRLEYESLQAQLRALS